MFQTYFHAAGRFLAFGLVAVYVCALGGNAHAGEGALDNFVLWKNTKFHRFFIDKEVNFSHYTKLAPLPLDYKNATISDSVRHNLQRNWETFLTKEVVDVSRFLEEALVEEIGDDKHFSLTKVADKDALIVQYIAKEFKPKAYLDNGMDTIGQQSLTKLCTMAFQIVIYDASTKKIVAFIESDLPVVAKPFGTERIVNNRANQNRAWITASDQLAKLFVKDLTTLVTKS